MRRLVPLLGLACLLALAGAGRAHAADAVTWCGTDEVAADRQPDLVSAKQIHVVYAYAADVRDRFRELASPIATDLAAIDSWWRAQDSGRTLRLDLFDFPGCATALGRLDISSVRLPHDSGFYSGQDSRFDRVRDDLGASFADPDKKYVVYFDGAVDDRTVCGQSPTLDDAGGRSAYAQIYLGSYCGDAVGSANRSAVVLVHELLHNLGALPQFGPPHGCPGDTAHPCDSRSDVLYPEVEQGGSLIAVQLDFGRDDYYGHSGAWRDIQDSLYLERLDGGDRQPPSVPAGLTATSEGGVVGLRWTASTDDVGPVTYEVFRDGVLATTSPATTYGDSAAAGETHGYEVRALDGAGRLSGRAGLRFTVGLGIVDAAGKLVKDTVAPGDVTGLRAKLTKKALTLRWSAAQDKGGLKGYEVFRNGRLLRAVVTTTLTVPRRQAKGRWSVRAVDPAGNRSAGQEILDVR